MEYGSANMHEESKRKRRIAAGGLQSCWRLRSLMNPFTHPVVTFQFVSHRVLRWTITPFCLAALRAWTVESGMRWVLNDTSVPSISKNKALKFLIFPNVFLIM